MAAFTGYTALDFSGFDRAIDKLGKRWADERRAQAEADAYAELSKAQGTTPGGLQNLTADYGQPGTVQRPAPVENKPLPSLVQNESGGNWRAQNNEVGSGGQRGHFGRLQFGQARLQEAAAAGAIPQGMTPQAFMASPEAQQSAERWHFGDIDQYIKERGLDRAVGQQINGVPVTMDGMRAVAHLGGKEGLAKFMISGGRYNPADANGTSLMDYFSRHGGQQGQATPVQVAQNTPPADLPAQGASEAQGFAIPQGAQPAARGNFDPQVIRRLLANPDTNALGKMLWQQALTGKNYNFLVLPDGSVARTDASSGTLQRITDPTKTEAQALDIRAKQLANQKAERELGQTTAPTTKVIKQADGSEVAVQWDGANNRWVPLQAPDGGEAVRPKGVKLTEQQSKDLVYYNRGLQALEAFEPNAVALASGPERLASNVPGGNYMTTEKFQLAQQAGDNFLMSILRKDTGAAITNQEQEMYGKVFLPQPGNPPAVLAQKAEARRQALDALRAGLGPAEVLALGQKLTSRQPGEAAPKAQDQKQTQPSRADLEAEARRRGLIK